MILQERIIGNAKLYLGDSIEILPLLKDIDLIVTDPPYPLTSGGKNTGQLGGKLSKDRYNNSGLIVDCAIKWRDFMPLLYNSLRPNAHCYTMSDDKNLRNMLNAANKSGFRFHRLLPWDKGNATPTRWYMKNCEFAGFFFKGKAFAINNCGDKQSSYVPQEPYGDHPTPKPVDLMRQYIRNSSQKGEIVLDPFMGSGATGVAAIKEGRSFIGIEKNEQFFNMACERISKIGASGDQISFFDAI